jgi:hypothetical protein
MCELFRTITEFTVTFYHYSISQLAHCTSTTISIWRSAKLFEVNMWSSYSKSLGIFPVVRWRLLYFYEVRKPAETWHIFSYTNWFIPIHVMICTVHSQQNKKPCRRFGQYRSLMHHDVPITRPAPRPSGQLQLSVRSASAARITGRHVAITQRQERRRR